MELKKIGASELPYLQNEIVKRIDQLETGEEAKDELRRKLGGDLLSYKASEFLEKKERLEREQERADRLAKASPEQRKGILIEEVQNFDKLKDVLKEIGLLKGALKEYQPDELINIITKVYLGELPADAVTRSHGLRNKVVELRDKHFEKEVNSVKN